jgi:hypothetical protein
MLNPLAGIISRKLLDFPSQALYMKSAGNLSYVHLGAKMSQQCMYVSDYRDYRISGKDSCPVRVFVVVLAI